MKQIWPWTLALLFSCSAYSAVDHEQKIERVRFLQQLASSSSFNLEAYQRDLQYEKADLSLEQRARLETHLLKLKISQQIVAAYGAALDNYGSEDAAYQEVKSAIERDMELLSPDLQADIAQFSYLTLEGAVKGVSLELPLPEVESAMLKDVAARSAFLNFSAGNEMEPLVSEKKDNPEKYDYSSKAELLKSLGSNGNNSRYMYTAHHPIRIGENMTVDHRISLRVAAQFLGVAIEAGPAINFITNFGTDLAFLAEGTSLPLLANGNFDYWQRDRSGKILVVKGERQRNYMAFFCESRLSFRTNYTGGGSFSFVGVGSGMSAIKQYSNSVSYVSRRLVVPETVGQQQVTLESLSRLCNQDFLQTRLEKTNLTVRQTLHEMMKNVVKGLRFSHPKTNCARDSHCQDWFRKKVLSLNQKNNLPRCIENVKEGFLSCEVRGLEGQRCAVKGRESYLGQYLNAQSEVLCDQGLKCVATRTSVSGIAQGRCRK